MCVPLAERSRVMFPCFCPVSILILVLYGQGDGRGGGYHGDGHHGWIRDIHRSLGIRSIGCILAQELEFGDIETGQLIQPYFSSASSTTNSAK